MRRRQPPITDKQYDLLLSVAPVSKRKDWFPTRTVNLLIRRGLVRVVQVRDRGVPYDHLQLTDRGYYVLVAGMLRRDPERAVSLFRDGLEGE